MAIQFRCKGCGQAIEVDDQYASRPVACPYCQTTVQAPAQSDLAATPAPMEAGSNPPLTGLAGSTSPAAWRPPQPTGPDPAWLCTLGFVCAVAIPLIFCLYTAIVYAAVGPQLNAKMQALQSQKADPQAQMQEFSEIGNKWARSHAGLSVAMPILIFAFVLVGLAASIAGLIKARTRRWQAIVGVIVCGSCTLCVGLGFLMTLMRGAAAGS